MTSNAETFDVEQFYGTLVHVSILNFVTQVRLSTNTKITNQPKIGNVQNYRDELATLLPASDMLTRRLCDQRQTAVNALVTFGETS